MYTLADLTAAPTLTTWIFLGLALGLALAFEFVNGFHDTANAVATVIYTHALKPGVAVVWSGLWNFLGVLFSTGVVAFGIIALLPSELVIDAGSAAGFAMVFALLISAIVWNLGTWYLGLPASSSHTLIGSILGVGLANAVLHGHSVAEGVNWGKAKEIAISLLVSPAIGFVCAALLLVALKALVRKPALFTEPEPNKPPELWIRCILILTCTGVSFFHGSNDGQKGMGLIVLILVGILPGTYALKMAETHEQIQRIVVEGQAVAGVMEKKSQEAKLEDGPALDELREFTKSTGVMSDKTFAALAATSRQISTTLETVTSFKDLSQPDLHAVRAEVYLAAAAIGKLDKAKKLTDPSENKAATAFKKELDAVTNYIPVWVKVAVACALGFGTTVGWKRIVVTVGEKIGKSHLTYGQGASAELVAMGTILMADRLGLPVSTTHILSSGVAGTMAANGSGLQAQTLRNILLAWVLTLPVCIFLGSALFGFGNYLVFHVFSAK